jgi:hypothetical protein
MTPAEMVHVKRLFRKTAPKKHPIQKALRKKETSTFLIIKEQTVDRIIEHTQNHLEDECRDYFKSCVPESNEDHPKPLEIQQEQPTIKDGQMTYRLRRYEK